MSQPIFSNDLLNQIRLGKYMRWAEHLTEDELLGLFWLVGELGARRRVIDKPMSECHGAELRAVVAQCALGEFWIEPLTLDKVQALMRGAIDEAQRRDRVEVSCWPSAPTACGSGPVLLAHPVATKGGAW